MPRKKENVMLISIIHDDSLIAENSDKKNHRNNFRLQFNKIGRLCGYRKKEQYSVTRISFRWSLAILFSLINIAGINNQIIYYVNTNKLFLRRMFLKILCTELSKNHMIKCLQCSTLAFKTD